MAITILQQPQVYSPAYNDLIFVVSSDNNTEDNFQYVFDVYKGATFLSRHRLPTNPDNGWAKFDARRVIESYVEHDIDIATENFAPNVNSYEKFKVKFGEEYDVSGTKTLYADLATSNDIYAFNSIFDPLNFVDYNQSDYLLVSSVKKFLTSCPNGLKVMSGDALWLYFINNDPTTIDRISIEVYNAAGALINSGTFSNSTYNTSTDDNKFLRVGAGPWNIGEYMGASFLNGASSYKVKIINGSGVAISETKTFTIDSSCTPYEVYRIHFLNKLGGFDAFNFIRRSDKSSDIQRSDYKKTAGDFTASGFAYSKSDRQVTTMSTSINDRLVLNSDWITESESVWLEELITSPVIFHELNGVLVPVSITDSVYQSQKRINNKIFNLRIEFRYSFSRYRQRY